MKGAALSALAAAVTIAWNAAADKSFYTGQRYDGSFVETAWGEARLTGVPPVSEITAIYVAPGTMGMVLGSNDSLTTGYSQLLCYQPLFGYGLEKFPRRPLRPGPALDEVRPGVLNVKNPACYLYPRENECAPGDHFGVERRGDAVSFLRYRPFPFVRSPVQRVADAVTLAALCFAAGVVLGSALLALRGAWRARATAAPPTDL